MDSNLKRLILIGHIGMVLDACCILHGQVKYLRLINFVQDSNMVLMFYFWPLRKIDLVFVNDTCHEVV